MGQKKREKHLNPPTDLFVTMDFIITLCPRLSTPLPPPQTRNHISDLGNNFFATLTSTAKKRCLLRAKKALQTTLISQISQTGNEGQVQLEVMGNIHGKKITESKTRLHNLLFVAVLVFETRCCCLPQWDSGIHKYSLHMCTREFDFACLKEQMVQTFLGMMEAQSWASSAGLCGTRHVLLPEGSTSHASAAFTFPWNTTRSHQQNGAFTKQALQLPG